MTSYSLETILTSIFMLTVSIVAVFGNLLVIVAILWNRRLRTVCNFLFLNLAVADMLQGAIAMPLRLADQLNQTGKKPLIPCLVVIPLTVFFFGASNFNLTLISLDRYFALKKPFLYPLLAVHWRLALIVAVSWVIIFIIAFLPIMGWGAACCFGIFFSNMDLGQTSNFSWDKPKCRGISQNHCLDTFKRTRRP